MGGSFFDMVSGLANLTNHPMGKMLSQFNQFRSNYSGDPKQEVQKMLQSGQMSQQQFNQLSQAAAQFQKMLGGRF